MYGEVWYSRFYLTGEPVVFLKTLFVCFWHDSPPPPAFGQGFLIPEVSKLNTSTHQSL
jgi:hypothetical protein